MAVYRIECADDSNASNRVSIVIFSNESWLPVIKKPGLSRVLKIMKRVAYSAVATAETGRSTNST
jgi:hypothetical protein